jgi:hypothetical protein
MIVSRLRPTTQVMFWSAKGPCRQGYWAVQTWCPSTGTAGVLRDPSAAAIRAGGVVMLAKRRRGGPGGTRTDEDDAGLQLLRQREHRADEAVGVPQPLAHHRAGRHVQQEAARLLRQCLRRAAGQGASERGAMKGCGGGLAGAWGYKRRAVGAYRLGARLAGRMGTCGADSRSCCRGAWLDRAGAGKAGIQAENVDAR